MGGQRPPALGSEHAFEVGQHVPVGDRWALGVDADHAVQEGALDPASDGKEGGVPLPLVVHPGESVVVEAVTDVEGDLEILLAEVATGDDLRLVAGPGPRGEGGDQQFAQWAAGVR